MEANKGRIQEKKDALLVCAGFSEKRAEDWMYKVDIKWTLWEEVFCWKFFGIMHICCLQMQEVGI